MQKKVLKILSLKFCRFWKRRSPTTKKTTKCKRKVERDSINGIISLLPHIISSIQSQSTPVSSSGSEHNKRHSSTASALCSPFLLLFPFQAATLLELLDILAYSLRLCLCQIIGTLPLSDCSSSLANFATYFCCSDSLKSVCLCKMNSKLIQTD